MDEDFVKKLREESTFVQSEKKHIVELYRQLLKKSEQLFNKQWLVSRQHLILEDLILGRNKFTITQCCSKYALLTNKTQFTESYKVFGHNDYYVGEFLKALREKPVYLGNLIIKSEKYNSSSASTSQLINGVDNQFFTPQQLIPIVFRSLYGNVVLKKDEQICLELLKYLLEIQFGGGSSSGDEQTIKTSQSSPNLIDFNNVNLNNNNNKIDLRRLIRKQSCSFNILFKLFTSFAYSTQLFLTAALYEPITQILTGEWFLDTDPDKALARFTTEEIIKRFGHPSSKEYKTKTQKYREKIVNELYAMTMTFIESISASLFCFPSSLTWLVSQLYSIVGKKSNSSLNNSTFKPTSQTDMARKLCCDLIMALYICPAICDPEPYGIIHDVQMSPVARHNLMQIANILQVLAMSDDDKDLKAQDLYSKFRNNCVSDIINSIITQNKSNSRSAQLDSVNSDFESGHSSNINNADVVSCFSDSSSPDSANSDVLLNRTTILISLQDIHKLLIYLRQVSKDQIDASPDSEEYKWLKLILPLDYLNNVLEKGLVTLNETNNQLLQAGSNSPTNSLNSSPSLLKKPNKQSFFISNETIVNCHKNDEALVITNLLKDTSLETFDGYKVIIVNISDDKESDCPGMRVEEKVLNDCESLASSVTSASAVSLFLNGHSNKEKLTKKSHQIHRDQRHNRKGNSRKDCQHPNKNVDNLDSSYEPNNIVVNGSIKITGNNNDAASSIDRDDVRSRHEGSVEGISEVCETNDCHSLSSNDEDDINEIETNQNAINDLEDEAIQMEGDGLSDFDNFSGRDTPIISGRDTPSSHSHEDLNNTSSNRNGNNLNNINTGMSGANGGNYSNDSSSNANLVGSNNNNNNINNNSINMVNNNNSGHNNINTSNSQIGSNVNCNNGNALNDRGNMMSLNLSRGPHLPLTAVKANREDINEKFCKFEINKVNGPVKEEQLSETGWSLDADPPESVNNEPINDRLGLDDTGLPQVNTINPSSNINNKLNNSRTSNQNEAQSASFLPSTNNSNSNSSNKLGNSSASKSINQTISANNNNDLISLNDDQESSNITSDSSIVNTNINNTVNSNINTVICSSSSSNQMNAAIAAEITNDQNLDDSLSVVSDSAAWSTDLIMNSDSDLESNSPSKYTPYSTYSSNCSGTNNQTSLLNQSLINALSSANTSQNSNFNSNQNKRNVDSGINSWNFSGTSSSNINGSSLNSTSQINSSQINIQLANSLSEQQLTSANGLANSTQNTNTNKNIFSSIFSGNSSNNAKKANIINQQKKNRFSFIPFKSNNTSNNSKQTSVSFSGTNSEQPPQPNTSQTLAQAQMQSENQSDTIENILKKYKTSSASNAQPSDRESQITESVNTNQMNSNYESLNTNTNSNTIGYNNTNNAQTFLSKNDSANQLQMNVENSLLYYDPNNLEQSKPFLDSKKKLRMVLSWPDGCAYNFTPTSHNKNSKETFLVKYLKIQLYDAISLQDKEKEAQLFETIRCVSIFNELECQKLMRSLKKDYIRRISYMTYLTKSKQRILYSFNLIDKLLRRAEWHHKLCTHHLASVVARMFLETKENENQMFKFLHDFRQLEAVDEKFDLFKNYIQLLKNDYDSIWMGCQEEMIQLGYLCLERLLLSKVYRHVMYPNGDIDHYRDSKVSECFSELANIITPSHHLIGIPLIYQNECPWTAAQIELRRLNIYKTPQDKLACIKKCMLTIQNLLAIAKSPVCADDLHPVLIYVIIKANPPTFLSNVQYIEGFYGKQLESEDYYWAQFIFAFSYIKANMLGNKVTNNE